MSNEKKGRRFTPGRFSFLSGGWWIVHILLIAIVFFLLTRIL